LLVDVAEGWNAQKHERNESGEIDPLLWIDRLSANKFGEDGCGVIIHLAHQILDELGVPRLLTSLHGVKVRLEHHLMRGPPKPARLALFVHAQKAVSVDEASQVETRHVVVADWIGHVRVRSIDRFVGALGTDARDHKDMRNDTVARPLKILSRPCS